MKSQRWSDEEVAELLALVEQKGQSAALKEFSAKSGRSVDAIRHKLIHVREEQEDSTAVPIEPEVVIESDGTVKMNGGISLPGSDIEVVPDSDESEMLPEDEPAKKECAFSKFVRWILGL